MGHYFRNQLRTSHPITDLASRKKNVFHEVILD